MPLRLPDRLPAIELLRKEGIAVPRFDAHSALSVRPLRIAILNLMPLKITTETDLIRILSASPLHLELQFVRIKGHVSKHTSAEHLEAFYIDSEEMRQREFDGLIVTGAPVEHLDFEDVTYWPELQAVFGWARTCVRSALYICWAAQAGLYHYYGIPKYPLQEKMFGIFPQVPLQPEQPILRGFDDVFFMPHSRHTEIRREDVLKVAELTLLAESELSGVSMLMAGDGRELFVTGHSEYSPMTLDTEYNRDLGKGLPIKKPWGYYRDDDPAKGPLVTWRAHGNLLFQNWINHYVNV